MLLVVQAMPESDYILDDGTKFEPCPLVQNPLDLTDTFSSNDENDIDEETMYVLLFRTLRILGIYSLDDSILYVNCRNIWYIFS